MEIEQPMSEDDRWSRCRPLSTREAVSLILVVLSIVTAGALSDKNGTSPQSEVRATTARRSSAVHGYQKNYFYCTTVAKDHYGRPSVLNGLTGDTYASVSSNA